MKVQVHFYCRNIFGNPWTSGTWELQTMFNYWNLSFFKHTDAFRNRLFQELWNYSCFSTIGTFFLFGTHGLFQGLMNYRHILTFFLEPREFIRNMGTLRKAGTFTSPQKLQTCSEKVPGFLKRFLAINLPKEFHLVLPLSNSS